MRWLLLLVLLACRTRDLPDYDRIGTPCPCPRGLSCVEYGYYPTTTCEIPCDGLMRPPEGDLQCPVGYRCMISDHGLRNVCRPKQR